MCWWVARPPWALLTWAQLLRQLWRRQSATFLAACIAQVRSSQKQLGQPWQMLPSEGCWKFIAQHIGILGCSWLRFSNVAAEVLSLNLNNALSHATLLQLSLRNECSVVVFSDKGVNDVYWICIFHIFLQYFPSNGKKKKSCKTVWLQMHSNLNIIFGWNSIYKKTFHTYINVCSARCGFFLKNDIAIKLRYCYLKLNSKGDIYLKTNQSGFVYVTHSEFSPYLYLTTGHIFFSVMPAVILLAIEMSYSE